MADLIRFAHRDDVPALVHLAHAQFGTIHPFTDGNGRTGRALVHAMLSVRQLTGHITVPISAGLLVNTGSYFDALTRYRAGDPEPIVRQFVDATFYAVGTGRRLVDELCAVRAAYRERTIARADSVVWPLIDSLIAQPVVTGSYVAESFGISGVAAQRAVDSSNAACCGRYRNAPGTGSGRPTESSRPWMISRRGGQVSGVPSARRQPLPGPVDPDV